jgi:hypothetical protein
MSSDNPFSKLGALEQKLFQETTPKPTVPLAEKTGAPSVRKSQSKKSDAKAVSSIPRYHKEESQSSHATVIPRHHDTMVSRNHETMIPGEEHGIFEVVRKSVKQIGKEAATHRFTLDEKNQLADIEYTYKRHSIRTSENEITRIAINYFIEDYRKHGEESLLAKILKRLNS